MASRFPSAGSFAGALAMPSGGRLARGMSRHAAGAMFVFAVWQAWLAASFSDTPGGAALPWAALVLLVVGAIPLARRLERRWHLLAHEALPCHGLLRAYRRDRALAWGLALIAPPLWMSSAWVLGRII